MVTGVVAPSWPLYATICVVCGILPTCIFSSGLSGLWVTLPFSHPNYAVEVIRDRAGNSGVKVDYLTLTALNIKGIGHVDATLGESGCHEIPSHPELEERIECAIHGDLVGRNFGELDPNESTVGNRVNDELHLDRGNAPSGRDYDVCDGCGRRRPGGIKLKSSHDFE